MENLGKKVLDSFVRKHNYYNQEQHPENYSDTVSEGEIGPDTLQGNLDKNQNISDSLGELLAKDEQRFDLEEMLDNIKSLEVYYLRLKTKIKATKARIQSLKEKQIEVDEFRLRDIQRKIAQLREKQLEDENELEEAEKVTSSYPEKIVLLDKELEAYNDFLDTYDEQNENFYNN
ncbi:hypothetical protein KC901_01885 [Patescibacteria group bacterium]|nr:hypothetical protein [Patescibacteria group bacterium]